MPVLEPAQVAPVKEVGEDPVTLRVPRSGRAVGSRRKDILQTLAKLLEDPQCDRITTALIAKKLKLSEAALYRVCSISLRRSVTMMRSRRLGACR